MDLCRRSCPRPELLIEMGKAVPLGGLSRPPPSSLIPCWDPGQGWPSTDCCFSSLDSEEDISKIQELAGLNKLEIIPLVQTFGHVEVGAAGCP